ncbi:hypothetical protein [Methylobacterium sp. J-068]|uniref:hypothetical protein n=1 Tax=Methylobacterium sp. J-068 TaxID=2836649 RepID=UPI001FB9A78E|nr:hypothetical protein [Methylobacterium sp. J-068]MCJ2033707.1 hypothetical protein [Methylobacterium sp. J-068]
MRLVTLVLAASAGAILAGPVQAQSPAIGGLPRPTTNSGGGTGGGSITGSSSPMSAPAPGAGGVRNPNAAPIPTPGRLGASGEGPSAPPPGARSR